ncbi:GerMN domain-containing protein [aff. Roholtiella sp. LEGE 12411]|uniref:GerMN domain-containing protein n=1 Tax=aff. Roholtiella sp. LEGE 12411 TaxID=1828822 RepID=UPI00187E3A53|nr:GerMN domain-containing protein [aff. Roholtiella sp. LEGE 12411]MBE9038871.1 GerMN domain-containing protein [aff. Roholtiella sp. LEGE 12411]
MSKIINTSKKYFLPFIVVAIAANLSSCNSSPIARNIDSETPAPVTTPSITSSPAPVTTPNSAISPTPSVAQLRDKSPNKKLLRDKPSLTSQAAANKTTNVTLYTSDVQCQELIPQKISVSAEEPVTNAVSRIIEKRDTSDFSLSGYRVNVNNGIATVDLRISPESKRQITSLSSCEQFALFGSLRKTLTSNAQWKIKEVRFTSRGEEIVF